MPTVVLLETDQLADGLVGRAPTAGLLPVAGRPLVCYTAAAFAACGDVDRIVLAGPTVYEKHPAALEGIDDTVLLDGPLGTVAEAVIDRYGDADELLVAATNCPLLRPEIVESFLANAPLEAGLTWGAAREERVRAAFPELSDINGHAFGGERVIFSLLLLVRPVVAGGQRDLLRRFLDLSVNRIEAVKVLGTGFVIKLTTGRASLEELTRRVGEVVGAPCVLQLSRHPEIVFRVRNRAEHHVARARLEGE